jgi:hypothetical protein
VPIRSKTKMDELKGAYANFLSEFLWDIYITQTFRGWAPGGDGIRYNNFGKISVINKGRRDGVVAVGAVWKTLSNKFGANRAFMAVEPCRYDGIHIHGLIHIPEWKANMPDRIKHYCEKAYGYTNSSQNMDLPLEHPDVNMYVSKYVTKGNEYFYLGGVECWARG